MKTRIANFPKVLRDASIATDLFGDAFDFDKMSFVEKMIVKRVAGVTETVVEKIPGDMQTFLEKMLDVSS